MTWERTRAGLVLAVAVTVFVRALWPHTAPQWLTWLVLALILALLAVTALRPHRRWPR